MKQTFLYFAYGSNMLRRRLLERTPSAVDAGVGYVLGRRLTFHMSSRDGSGKCDIEPSNDPQHRVHGVLYEIALEEKPILDRAESLGVGYDEELVTVVIPTGTLLATAYVALVKDPTLQPYHWYKDIVVAGAEEHSLPHEYVEGLRLFASKPDRDEQRHSRHAALLPDSYRSTEEK